MKDTTRVLTLEVPSLHDGIDLDCRICHPSTSLPAAESSIKGAIIAHPYAPLGGCYDDPVVQLAVEELLQTGFVVGVFNFRGAGLSAGHTSWTAKAETADYRTFVIFLLLYLRNVNQQGSSASGDQLPIDLLLGGYSYGAMITTLLPPTSVLLSRVGSDNISISDRGEDSAIAKLAHRAGQLARAVQHEIAGGGPLPPALQSASILEQTMTIPQVRKTAYMLISPILGSVAGLATMFTSFSTRSIGEEKLVINETLVIYGDGDAFTSHRRLRRWCEDLQTRSKDSVQAKRSQCEFTEVQGAGHFWREDGAEAQLRTALHDWISSVTDAAQTLTAAE